MFGAGLSITGPTLRAFRQLGVIDEVREAGFFSPSIKMFAQNGTPLAEIANPPLEPGIPAAGGILRPVLHRILSERTRAGGTNVRLGLSVAALADKGEAVEVRFTDGSTERYDLVIGADGCMSRIRQLLFPDAPVPKFTGQGCWRVLADRPAEVTGAEIYFGNHVKAGLNPCSPDKMYMFVTSAMPGNPRVDPVHGIHQLADLIAPFGGTVGKVRDSLGEDSSFNYRPLEALLLPRPWSVSKIGVVGDAAHATTPHLASGAGIAVEDGLVLAEEMIAADTVEEGWRRFEERRWERCRMVIETSVRIGDIEIAHGPQNEIAGLMEGAARRLAEAI